jgi:hypothetical protein
MNNPLRTSEGYELFLYTLMEQFPSVRRSPMTFTRRVGEKFCWYDSQPHPGDPLLVSTHPHHKHIPPDIKHHRIPAPEMSFMRPNLPLVISEIEEVIENIESEIEPRRINPAMAHVVWLSR